MNNLAFIFIYYFFLNIKTKYDFFNYNLIAKQA